MQIPEEEETYDGGKYAFWSHQQPAPSSKEADFGDLSTGILGSILVGGRGRAGGSLWVLDNGGKLKADQFTRITPWANLWELFCNYLAVRCHTVFMCCAFLAIPPLPNRIDPNLAQRQTSVHLGLTLKCTFATIFVTHGVSNTKLWAHTCQNVRNKGHIPLPSKLPAPDYSRIKTAVNSSAYSEKYRWIARRPSNSCSRSSPELLMKKSQSCLRKTSKYHTALKIESQPTF